jgi:hypothetical protein
MSNDASDAKPAGEPDITPQGAAGGAGTAGPSETPRLRDLVLAAAESIGEDGKGEGGVHGYMRRLALNDARVFASLFARGLQAAGEDSEGATIQNIGFRNIYAHPDR